MDDENDPLKRLLQSYETIEPSGDLRNRIWEGIERNRARRPLWLVKPALVASTAVLVSLFGTMLSLNLTKRYFSPPEPDSITQWTRLSSDRTLQ